MDIEVTRKNILESDKFVIDELKKVQFLFGLKNEIRYGLLRDEQIESESVAEHIYGIGIINEYFLPLEDCDGTFDRTRISQMIMLHDADEVVVGDTIGYLKTDAVRQQEKDAMQYVSEKLPECMKKTFLSVIDEYEARETREAQYVRALDKIEPLFHLYNGNGKAIIQKNHQTREESHRIKDQFVKDFPYIKRFNEVMNEQMDLEGFFSPQLPLGSL